MTVADVFELEGRIVLSPGVDDAQSRDLTGKAIELERPDGTWISAHVAGLEIPTPNPSGMHPVAVAGVTKGDIPPGTVVWTARDTD